MFRCDGSFYGQRAVLLRQFLNFALPKKEPVLCLNARPR